MAAKSNFIVRGGADFSGIKREIIKTKTQLGSFEKDTNKKIKSVAAGFKSFAKAGLAIAGVTSVIAGLKSSFNSFVELESAVMRVNFIFGSAAKNVEEFANTTAKSLGMAESSVYNYAAIYGNLFRNITKNSEENSKVTVAMLQASAVVASKTGRTMDDVLDRIRSGLLGNTEAIEDLGINVNVGMLEMTDAFKRIANGRSWEQLSFYEQQQIRTLGILEQAHKNFGDTVQYGSAYSLSTLSSAFKDLTSYAGQFVNAGLQPIIKGLTELVRAATNGIKALAGLLGLQIKTDNTSGVEAQVEAQQDLTDEIKETAKAQKGLASFDELNILSLDKDTDTAGATTGIGGNAFAGINVPEPETPAPDTSWLTPVQTAFSKFLGFIQTKFEPTISSWGKAFNKISDPAKKAFDKVQTSSSKLWNQTLAPFGKYIVNDWVPSIYNSFSENFAPIFSEVMPVLFNEFALGFEFACNQISRVYSDILKPNFEQIKIIAIDAFGGIKKAWDKYGAQILDGFQTFKDSVRTIWNNIYENIFQPVFTKIADIVSWLWDKHLKKLWDNLTDFFGNVAQFVLMIWNNYLSPFVNWIVTTFGPHIANAVSFIGSVFGTVFGGIADLISGILQALSGLITFLTSVFTGDWKKAWQGIKDIFKGIWDTFAGIVKIPLNLIIDMLNFVIRGLNKLSFDIPDWVPEVGGKKFGINIPEIPKLAQGGIVSGRSIVEVAEYTGARTNPEVIAPLDKLRDMIADVAGAGGDINLTANIVLDDGTLIGKIVERISRQNRLRSRPIMGV